MVIDLDIASPNKGMFNGAYDFDITINYSELQTFEEPKDKLERLDSYRNKGLINPLQYYFELTGDETVKTNEEAIEAINKNLELFELIKQGDNGTDSTTGLINGENTASAEAEGAEITTGIGRPDTGTISSNAESNEDVDQ